MQQTTGEQVQSAAASYQLLLHRSAACTCRWDRCADRHRLLSLACGMMMRAGTPARSPQPPQQPYRSAAHLAELLHRLEVQVVEKVVEVAAAR